MTRSATKPVIVSATAHIGLVLSVLALGTEPSFMHVCRSDQQHVVLLAPVTKQKPAVPPRHAPRPAISPSKILGSAARTMKVQYAAGPPRLVALTPPALEAELPLPNGDGLSGAFGPDSVGNGGGAQRLSNSCRAQPSPVEILFKPKPAYSLEGRELHLEGDVLLQVVYGV